MTPEQLQEIAAWADELTAEEARRAAAGITQRDYEAGAYVCHRGDTFEFWTGVVSGIAKIATISPDGKPISYSGIPAGGWFGEGAMIKREERQYDIVAVRDTRLALMNAGTFNWLFESSTGFNRFLVCQLNERLGQFIGTLGYDRMLDTTGRLARCIAWLFNPVLFPRVGDCLAINQEELGQLCGISRQATNRSLKALQDEGLIAVSAEGVRIRDMGALSRYGD